VRSGRRVLLDFQDVETIRPGALVYLLAQVHKLRMEFGHERVTGSYPVSARVDRLLEQSGFYSLLNVKSRKEAKIPNKLLRYIRFRSDQKLNAAVVGEIRDELLRADLTMPAVVRRTVFRAVTEAMANVNHHAYLNKAVRTPQAADRWWMLASLNVPKNRFTLVFYDAGVGIPKTLPLRYPIEVIRRIVSLLPGFEPDDGQMIDAAMQLGRTRTAMHNRGKGLQDLARLIDEVAGGMMRITSRHGCYTYTHGSGQPSKSYGFLEGTLIEWQLPLSEALDELPDDLHDKASHDS